MRCFIAIDFPEDVKRAINEVILKVRDMGGVVKWVSPGNMHLTLKFLGEVKDETARDIQKSLSSVCSGHKPFSIYIRGAGAFPDFRSPNVLWAGIEASPELEGLFMDIDRAVAEFGFERETRRFSPHLTIGRVKDKRGIEPVMKVLSEFKGRSFGTVEAKEVLLMKSVLKPAGAEYSRIGVSPLKSQPEKKGSERL